MGKVRARRRGEGSIYVRSTKYWIKYYHQGKPKYEPTGAQPECGAAVYTTDKDAERKALAYLAQVMKRVSAAELGHAAYAGGGERKLKLAVLLDDVVTRYEARCVRDNKDANPSLYSEVKRAKEWFGEMRAMDITDNFLEHWTIDQLPALRAEFQPATINRTLEYVRMALRLGVAKHKLSRMPTNISAYMLTAEEKENARKGFFEWAEFQALLSATADEDLKDFYWFGYLTGWRSGSIKKLRWETVDMNEHMLLARAKDTKQKRKNLMPLGNDGDHLWELMKRRKARRAYKRADGADAVAEHVFHRSGAAIGDFRKAWATACKAAGLTKKVILEGEAVDVPSKMFHDFRRTAARDIYAATGNKDVAKAITGHVTDSMFDRYNIIIDEQKVEAINARFKKVSHGK